MQCGGAQMESLIGNTVDRTIFKKLKVPERYSVLHRSQILQSKYPLERDAWDFISQPSRSVRTLF